MEAVRALLVGVLLTVAVVVQASVLARLGLPGAAPQLVVVAVAGVALAGGPAAGAIAGFAAGLLADVAPPAVSPIGLSALVLVLVGWSTGLLRGSLPRLPARLAAVAAVTVAALAAASGLAMMLGAHPGPWPALAAHWSVAAAYDVALGLLLLPPVGWFWRRLDPPPLRGYPA